MYLRIVSSFCIFKLIFNFCLYLLTILFLVVPNSLIPSFVLLESFHRVCPLRSPNSKSSSFPSIGCSFAPYLSVVSDDIRL